MKKGIKGWNTMKLLILSGIIFYLAFPTVSGTSGGGDPILPIFTGNAEGLEEIKEKVLEELFSENNSIDWGAPSIDMIIITPNKTDFIQAAQVFAEWKTSRGIPTQVVSNFTLYPGEDTPAKIRSAIQWYYETFNIDWVLLLGDTASDLIPIRYIRNEDTQLVANTYESVGGNTLKPTDFYYAELTGNWNEDGDEFWGENATNNAAGDQPEMDFIPEVYVGRLPVDSIDEVYAVLNKTMIYESGINAGSWTNEYLGLSGISDYAHVNGDSDGEDEAYLGQYVIDNYVNGSMEWIHALEHTSSYEPLDDSRIENIANYDVTAKVNDGVSVIFYAGHGSSGYLATKGPGNPISTTSLNQWTNSEKLPLIYASACSTNAYDAENGLGEKAILKENGGVIGYIGATRVSWYYPNDTALKRDNRGMSKLFFQEMFENHNYQQGKALYEAKKAYVASEWFEFTQTQKDHATNPFLFFEMERKTIISYMLLGDPSVDIYTNIPMTAHLEIPLNVDVYKSSNLRVPVNYSNGDPIPYARVVLENSEGVSEVFIADAGGIVEITTPDVETINYTIYGHNVKTEGEFILTLSEDTEIPEMSPNSLDQTAKIEINSNWTGSFILEDLESGPLNAFFILCDYTLSEFEVYQMYANTSVYWAKSVTYSQNLNQLEVGKYKYFVVGVDGSGNYDFALDTIPLPSIKVVLPLSFRLMEFLAGFFSIGLIGVVIWKSIRLGPKSSIPLIES
jgi:hypothetical protein